MVQELTGQVLGPVKTSRLVIFLIARCGKKVLEVPFRCINKVAGHEIVLRFTVRDFPNSITVEAEKGGARVAENNGRVSRDEELSVAWCLKVVDDFEERKLALR